MIVLLKQGHRVYVGMNLPFFVPEAMIETKLKALGLSNFTWFDRGTANLAVTPTEDQLYTDDWNKWLEADYTGPDKRFEEKKIWSWLIQKPK